MFIIKFFKNSFGFKDKRSSKLLTHQSDVINNMVTSFLEIDDLENVVKVNHSSHEIFNKSRLVKSLLQAVVFGEYNKVETLLQKYPHLLLERGTIKDYSGRVHVNRTALQLALGACDYDVENSKHVITVRGMVELIIEYFNHLPYKNSQWINKVILDQYENQLPSDDKIEAQKAINDAVELKRMTEYIEKASQRECAMLSSFEERIHTRICKHAKEKCYPTLNKIMQSFLHATSPEMFEKFFVKFEIYITNQNLIVNNDFNFDLLKALYQFRYYLQPKASFNRSTHFNHDLLFEALELYEKNFARFGDTSTSPKNAFFWQKVVGGIECYLPACDAERIASSEYEPLEERKSDRTMVFRQNEYGKFFPLKLTNSTKLGINTAYFYGGEISVRAIGITWLRPSKMLKTYFEQKKHRQIVFEKKYRDLNHKSISM